jgi:hypothetical protein
MNVPRPVGALMDSAGDPHPTGDVQLRVGRRHPHHAEYQTRNPQRHAVVRTGLTGLRRQPTAAAQPGVHGQPVAPRYDEQCHQENDVWRPAVADHSVLLGDGQPHDEPRHEREIRQPCQEPGGEAHDRGERGEPQGVAEVPVLREILHPAPVDPQLRLEVRPGSGDVRQPQLVDHPDEQPDAEQNSPQAECGRVDVRDAPQHVPPKAVDHGCQGHPRRDARQHPRRREPRCEDHGRLP